MADVQELVGDNSLTIFIFLNTGLVKTEEADLIEDKNQEYQNNKNIY
jgi:hypothetical protein